MSMKMLAPAAAVMAALASAELSLVAPSRRRLNGHPKSWVQCAVGPNGSKGAQNFAPEGWSPSMPGFDLAEPGVVQLFRSAFANVQARIDYMNHPCSEGYTTFPNIRAVVAEGTHLCKYKYEAFADPPMLKVTNRSPWSETKYEGYDAIEAYIKDLAENGQPEGSLHIGGNEIVCPSFQAWSSDNGHVARYGFTINSYEANGFPYSMELQWSNYGEPIHGISRKRLGFVMKIHDFADGNYRDNDWGACTKRGGPWGPYAALVSEDKIIFTEEFPGAPEVVCTDAPTREPTLAPTTEMPTPEPTPATCGQPGKVGKKSAQKLRGIKGQLNGSKTAPSACVCKDACQAIGGTEFMWKPKKGRCRCFAGATVITYNSKKGKRIAGVIEGSTAEIVVKSEDN